MFGSGRCGWRGGVDERTGFGLYQSCGNRGSVGRVSVLWFNCHTVGLIMILICVFVGTHRVRTRQTVLLPIVFVLSGTLLLEVVSSCASHAVPSHIYLCASDYKEIKLLLYYCIPLKWFISFSTSILVYLFFSNFTFFMVLFGFNFLKNTKSSITQEKDRLTYRVESICT